MFVFDKSRLLDCADRYKAEFWHAEPFPHVVIDDFLPVEWAEQIHAAFPTPDSMERYTYQDYENKIALRPDVPACPPKIEHVLNALNSGKFITFLEVLTDIQGLIPDPHFEGGGLHQTMPSGKLGIHVDFNLHKALNLYRRLNVIIYLNKDWQDNWGGYLELWDRDNSRWVRRIAPQFNRCVIFETSKYSWHGHPDPLRCPSGTTRKSIAIYYYTTGAGNQNLEYHWTRHRARPNSNDDPTRGRHSIRRIAKLFVPPIVGKVRNVLVEKFHK